MAKIIALHKQTSLLGNNDTGCKEYRSYADMFRDEQVSIAAAD